MFRLPVRSRGLAFSAIALGAHCWGLSQQAPGIVPGTRPAKQANAPSGYTLISPVIQPTLSPGVILLVELEQRFAKEVAEGGGKAFAAWFADDAVTLSNGKPAVLGRGAISQAATWSPQEYQLTWITQGAQMGPSSDMGFTWGHYEGHAKDRNGQVVLNSGRYLTVWRRLPNGSWKVALDASAEEPAAAGDCCTLPKP